MWRRILENGGQGVLPRIVTIENTQIMCLVSQRSKATVAVNSSSNNDYDDEWKTAKPFEEIPGYRSYPIVGTMWSMLPVIGIHASLIDQTINIHYISSPIRHGSGRYSVNGTLPNNF